MSPFPKNLLGTSEGSTQVESSEVLKIDGIAVTVKRAAAILHCSRSRVFQLIASGEIQRAQSAGRKTLVITAALTAFLLSGAEMTPSPVIRRYQRRRPKNFVPPSADRIPL